jgi:hypothetical protein
VRINDQADYGSLAARVAAKFSAKLIRLSGTGNGTVKLSFEVRSPPMRALRNAKPVRRLWGCGSSRVHAFANFVGRRCRHRTESSERGQHKRGWKISIGGKKLFNITLLVD